MASLEREEKEYDVYDFYKMLQSPWQNLYVDIRDENIFKQTHPRFSINIPVGMNKDEIIKILRKDIQAQQNIIANMFIYSDILNEKIKHHIYCVLPEILKTNFLLFPKTMIFNDQNGLLPKQYPFLCVCEEKKKECQDDEKKLCHTKQVKKYLQLAHKKRKKKGYLTLLNERMGNHLEYPDQILNDRLFLGGYDAASNKEVMINLEITHIVNCTQLNNEFEKDKELNIKYFQIPIKDVEQALIGLYFNQVIEFIDNAIKQHDNNKIFVHCHRGVSRSSTIIIAYLMKMHSMTMNVALKYVEEKRNIIDPNEGFRFQLKYFQDNAYKIDNKSLESGLKQVANQFE